MNKGTGSHGPFIAVAKATTDGDRILSMGLVPGDESTGNHGLFYHKKTTEEVSQATFP